VQPPEDAEGLVEHLDVVQAQRGGGGALQGSTRGERVLKALAGLVVDLDGLGPAPLARFVAENYDALPKPFRRYQVGQVYRNEKPGPGRFREFTQFDADTVGTASPVADAEGYMMLCDVFEALGLGGEYAVKVNDRKILNGILEAIGISAGPTRRRSVRAPPSGRPRGAAGPATRSGGARRSGRPSEDG
jgi:hypothetical protein